MLFDTIIQYSKKKRNMHLFLNKQNILIDLHSKKTFLNYKINFQIRKIMSQIHNIQKQYIFFSVKSTLNN